MAEFVDSDIVDDCIQLLVHEYLHNWSTYKRVFGNLSSPNLGRVEAIYPHKMHEVIIQVLSCKGVVVKNISRTVTNAVLKQLGLDPHRKQVVYLDEFLNHVKPKLSFRMFEPKFAGCPTPPGSRSTQPPKIEPRNEVTVSGDSAKGSGKNLRKKLSHIPVLQSHPNPSKNSIPRPPSARRSRSRNGSSKMSLNSRENLTSKDHDRQSAKEEKTLEYNKAQHQSRPQSRLSRPRPASAGSGSLHKARCDTPKYSCAAQLLSSTSSRPSSSHHNIATPVFNSFCERSTSLDQRTLCVSPYYCCSEPPNPNPNPNPTPKAPSPNATSDVASQTLLTMELFSTRRTQGSRGKSQSPRDPQSKKKEESNSAEIRAGRTERTLRESGENFKRLIFKKLTPWRKSSCHNVSSAAEEKQMEPSDKGDQKA